MILRALFLRPTLRRPARFLATAGGVALGVAAVVATSAGSRTAVATLAEDVTALAGERSLEIVRVGGVDETVMGALAPFCERWSIVPIVEEIAHVTALGDVVRVLGVDLLVETRIGERVRRTAPAIALPSQEAFESLLHERAALFPRELCEQLDLRAGERCEILARGERIELIVAGSFEPSTALATGSRTLFVDVALAQELFGRVGELDRIVLRPRLELDLENEIALVSAALPAGYLVREPFQRARETQRTVAALDFNLRALSGVSIVVGIVLVATALATSVVERRERIALLRSLGASRGQLARAIFVECAAIGSLGGALGAWLGWLGSRLAFAGVQGSLASIVPSSPAGTLRFDPRSIGLGILLGAGTAVVAGLLPLREALATPPIQGLRTEHPGRSARRRWLARGPLFLALLAAAYLFASLPPLGDRPLWALCAALALLATMLVLAEPLVDLFAGARTERFLRSSSPTLRLAQAALAAGRRRAGWAAGAVGVAMALAISMTTMIGSFRSTLVEWNEQALHSDLYVQPLEGSSGVAAGRLDPEVERVAREVLGETAVDAFVTAQARSSGRPITLAGADFVVAARASTMPFLERRPAREVFAAALAQGACVVNESFANRFDVERGDRIQIETAGTTIEREIAGAYRNYSHPLGLVVIDRADFEALHPGQGPESLTIHLPEGRSVLEARAALLERLGERFAIEVLPNAELRERVLAVFERTFAVTGALRLVASAVAVITVLFALVSERRRELALARVLGASRAQVLAIVLFEGGILGAAGALGGLLVGLAVGWLLVRIVNVQSFGWTLSFLPPWGALAWTLLAALAASFAAGLAPAARALRMVPAEVLREEG